MFDDLSSRVEEHSTDSLRDRVWRVIFLSDTRSGKAFDVILLWLIGISVFVVMIESVPTIQEAHRKMFNQLEWMFTILFTIEYAVRIWVVRNKKSYVLSFFGIVDLLSLIPTYLTIFIAGPQYLLVVRVLRLLRVFRILKMARHIGEANMLMNAFRASAAKITVFLFLVLAVTLILGTMMYIVEGVIAKNPGFSSIPQSVYWGIVTISTVIILIGYGTIAVPTGIVTAELNMNMAKIHPDKRKCKECGHVGHDSKARYCKMCSTEL